MGGSDTSRGINFQYACALSFILKFPLEPQWQTIQLEGRENIEDILILGNQGQVLVRAQVKQKEDPYQWEPAELKNVLMQFAKCEGAEETVYQFIYAGSEGKAFNQKVRPIFEKIEFEGFHALSFAEKNEIVKHFNDEIATFLQKTNKRFKLVKCGSWENIKAKDLATIRKLSFPKVFSSLNENLGNNIYRDFFEKIAEKSQNKNKYERMIGRDEIIATLRNHNSLVETWQELKLDIIYDIQNYLEGISIRLSNLPEYYPKGVFNFDQIRQKVKLSQNRLVYNPNNAFARETARRLGAFEEDDEQRQIYLEEAYQWRGTEMYETAMSGVHNTVVRDWEEIRDQFHRAIILGDPGFGKSWLLRYEGRRIAAEQLTQLKKQKVNEDEINFPVHMRLSNLAEYIDKNNPNLPNAILLLLQNEYDISKQFSFWIKQHIYTSRCVLLLDALDEVAEEKKTGLVYALENFAANSDCHILLSSRIAGYRKAPFFLKDGKWSPELELVAFDWEQIHAFIKNWFSQDATKEKELINVLRTEPVLRTQARIPLLLSFICLIATRNIKMPKRRSELYETVLDLLMEGPWRELHLREYDEGRLEAKRNLLMYIAWHFANNDNRWRDLLPSNELNSIIQSSEYALYMRESDSHKQTALWELSERDGILVKAGNPDVGVARIQIPYLFLHRTFHEFLVASYLSSLEIKKWLSCIKSHLWFDPDWEIVIILLAGCLKAPQELLEAILNERDDVFHSQLLLAGRCLAELKENSVSDKIRTKILSQLLKMLQSTSERDRYQASLVIGQIGSSAIPEILPLLKSEKYYTRAAVVRSLGQIGHSSVISDLLGLLRDPNEHYIVRSAIATALGEINDNKGSIDALLPLIRDKYEKVRIASIEALSTMGTPVVVDSLLALILDRKEKFVIHNSVSRSLKTIGSLAEEKLLSMLKDKNVKNKFLLYSELEKYNSQETKDFLYSLIKNRSKKSSPSDLYHAIEALSKICGEECLDLLIEVLYDSNSNGYLDEAVIRALSGIKSKNSADLLKAIFEHSKQFRARRTIAAALASIGEPYATDGVILALNDKSSKVRQYAITSLSEVSDPRLIALLIKFAMQDNNHNTRYFAMNLLTKQRHENVIDYWLTILFNKESPDYAEKEMAIRGITKANRDKQKIIDKLLEILYDENEQIYIKLAAIDSLIELGENSFLKYLLDSVASKVALNAIPKHTLVQKIEKVMQSGDPTYCCELIFKYWAETGRIRNFRSMLYDMLSKIGPRLRANVGEDWQTWRNRLMPYTNYVLKGSD